MCIRDSIQPLIEATKEQQSIIDENKNYCEVNFAELNARVEKNQESIALLQKRSDEITAKANNNDRSVASLKQELEQQKIINKQLQDQLNKTNSRLDAIEKLLSK